MKPQLFLFAIFVAFCLSSTFAKDANIEQQRIAREGVEQMVQAGVLRIDIQARAAWVSPILWAKFDAEGKANAAAAMAIYCSARDPIILIYDAQSARKIARWGYATGLEILQ